MQKDRWEVCGLMVVLILIAPIFVAISPSTTADDLRSQGGGLSLDKQTYPDSRTSYHVGDPISYVITLRHASVFDFVLDIWDVLPDGTIIYLDNDSYFTAGQSKTYWVNTTVGADWVDPDMKIRNRVYAQGYDENPTQPDKIETFMTKTSSIIPPFVRISPENQVVQAGNSFFVNITVENVSNMGGVQAMVKFDPRAMQATAIIEGNFLNSGGDTLFIEQINNTVGTAYFASALSRGGVSGSGVLATILFDTNVSAKGTFSLTLTDVLLSDGTGAASFQKLFNGSATLSPFSPVLVIISPENKTYPSISVNLKYLVESYGIGLNWTQYSLDGGEYVGVAGNTTITGLGVGDHSMVMRACDAQGNLAVSNTVNFTIHPGDINGDGNVNLFDLQQMAWAFLSYPADLNWNENADLNCDNVVNLFDLQILAWNLFNSYA
ncbi:MAG: cohesin domain-containing protein [Candidatus Methanospirareceae archaeon]